MKKSLIISHITACDYPLFREWIRKWGVNFFDEIIIYWDVQFRYPFYWAFIQQDLSQFPEIKFIDPVPVEKDWRATSTSELIKHATGDWIFSIEQDWFVQDWEKFFNMNKAGVEAYDLFGWWNPTNAPYIHPAFWAIKRELLEKTSKDFSAHPEINGSDHFAMITYDVEKLGKEIGKFEANFNSESFMFHLGGVNQNYLNGLTDGFQFHRPEAFFVLNRYNMNAEVPQDPKFIELCKKIDKILTPTDIYEETRLMDKWGKFFTV